MVIAHAGRRPSAGSAGNLIHIVAERAIALVAASAERILQAMCGLGGHEMAYHFERNRVSLHCLHCGQRTPGWTIGRAVRSA